MHKAPAIKAWLGRRPRFHVHFTPTGSSWINRVERWFGHLTDKLIHRGTHRSVQALEADTRTWIQPCSPEPVRYTQGGGLTDGTAPSDVDFAHRFAAAHRAATAFEATDHRG
ncbi:transposase [Streptomyces sp. NBC_01210]|uniref:transposase n=1 Tax=Streptomyces sp. NBC_01210 TaxID=2903774 RepID=UPI002E0F577A